MIADTTEHLELLLETLQQCTSDATEQSMLLMLLGNHLYMFVIICGRKSEHN
jgi:hypothetical protein